jgi:hypothetical protein
LELRKVTPAAALLAAALLLTAGCGGTLEGKYRRGQLTTSTTAGQRAPANSPTTAPTTSSTVPTSGNAARQGGRG